jgi:2-keto-4-pentenoate hydratase/2-oxohepta-3-ene-1,7-dioic acid hydratase in catechol pathway
MRLVTFATSAGSHLGVVDGDEIADITSADNRLGPDLGAVLAAGLLEEVAGAIADAPRIALSGATLASPVLRPPKFLAIGLNYAKHVAESGMDAPAFQLWFNKQSTCAIGHRAPIHVPKASAVVDYEGELAFVIGRRCRHVPAKRAAEVIAGYTICNDVSVRDWQVRTPTMTMGKSFDTHGPLGPWVVTPDELGDPHRLSLRTWVNDELRQDGRTDDLIYDCFEMVEHLSTAFTLEPGDVISTGTPAGVGIAMKPPGLLKADDVVRIEIEGIGVLENPVIDEPDSTAIGLD